MSSLSLSPSSSSLLSFLFPFFPSSSDLDTINFPFPNSNPTEFYSELWGYDVRCHPDAYRDPLVMGLWVGLLWVGVLVGGGWVFWRRGEVGVSTGGNGKGSGNLVRLGVWMVVGPVMGWVGLGGVVVLVAGRVGWVVLTGLGGLVSWDGRKRRVVLKRAREVWTEGVRLAVGPVGEPSRWSGMGTGVGVGVEMERMQEEGLGGVEEGKEDGRVKEEEEEGEKVPGEIGRRKEQHIYTSREKRVIHSAILDRTHHLDGLVEDTDKASLSTTVRPLHLVAVALLGHLSTVTLLLSQRRANINANAIVDDMLWHVALTGLAVCAQAMMILFRTPAASSPTNKEQLATPVHSKPSLEETSSQTTASSESSRPKISAILLLRFGGLVHDVNVNVSVNNDTVVTKTQSENQLTSLGRLGPFDIYASIVIFQLIVNPRGGNDADYPHLDRLIDIVSKTVLLGLVPYIWTIAFVLVAVTLTVAHLLLSRVIPNSRAVAALERLSPQMEDAVKWTKARVERLPETLRWVVGQCYYPLWILCVYTALYVITVQEVVRFDTTEWLRANNYECLDLWRDPLAEKLLWPIFLASRKSAE